MTNYPRRTFLRTTVLAAAAAATTRANITLGRWSQDGGRPRGLHHPFFAQAKTPDVIAHRGGNGQWPGETMYAMKNARALPCDVLEMDVYLTKDRELILMHDIEVRKTTSGTRRVYEYTLKEITKLRADYRWSPDCKTKVRPGDFEQRKDDLLVPTLQQVLQQFPEMRFVIEMKKAPAAFSPVARLSELLKSANMTDKVLVASFHRPFMQDFRRSLPDVATSFSLSIEDAASLTSKAVQQLIQTLLNQPPGEQGADALQLPYPFITKHVVQKAKDRGLALHAWTVNSSAAMKTMMSLGVDGIITDCPEELLRRLGRLSAT